MPESLNTDVLTFVQFAKLNESTYGSLEDAKTVIMTLRRHGFVGYLAGGCVRDFLTGNKPKDFDVATDATPDELVKIFPGADLVGKQFGVVISHGIDIATFRKDGTYSDGRRPDSVEFSRSPEDDSKRRDFTINAMFMDPFSGEILDFHGGRMDAQNNIIRAVGNPNDRFTQDYLRMLRAHRFAAKLKFDIHPETMAAMQAHAHNISKIDVERIQQELTKALAHDAHRTIAGMQTSGMLIHILPEVANLSSMDLATTMQTLAHVGASVSVGMGLAAVLCKVPVHTVTGIGKRLKLTNDEIKHTVGILELQTRISEVTPHTTLDVLKRLMRAPFFEDALKLYSARVEAMDHHASGSINRELSNLYSGMKQEDLHPEKFVTGDDLIKILGMKPGIEFKRILDAAENGQLTGHIKSKAQALEMIRHGQL